MREREEGVDHILRFLSQVIKWMVMSKLRQEHKRSSRLGGISEKFTLGHEILKKKNCSLIFPISVIHLCIGNFQLT